MATDMTMALALVILGNLVGMSAGLPKHSLFVYEQGEGLIRLHDKPDLRLNVKGGAPVENGSPLILWPCGPLNHELFKFEKGLFKLMVDESLCLNVAGGANAGSGLSLWPCEQGGSRVDHEEFEMKSDGRIVLKQNPTMCLNIKEGNIGHGGEVVLWPCADQPSENELFSVEEGYIKVKSKPDFHFNVQGELKAEAKVVLWSCQAGAHEAFDLTADGRIKLRMRPEMCLNAEGGVGAGQKIIAWPCSEHPEENELFEYDFNKKTLYSKKNPDLGFNAAGGAMQAGDEIVLWSLKDTDEL